ncbi:MAG: endo-1,4-beta-xylanase [Verrucomicrobiae bacterium]|nr:endo-1,4-beta-xylanase [Verrucomicrobiae bacterium]
MLKPEHRLRSLFSLLVLAGLGIPARADWKSEANARIEQIRKRDWVLVALDSDGQPVAGATVEVRQRRHDFAFGCALNSFALVDQPRYADFFSRHFEWAVFENETKWPENEPVQGQVNYTRADLMLAFCRKHGITTRGHTLFWETTQAGYEHPAWLDSLTSEQLRAAVLSRLDSVVPRYRGIFPHWDINNEMLHGRYFRDRLGDGIVPLLFQRTGALDPTVKRFVNDYNVLAGTETAAYRTQITQLLAAGAPVEGIGVQGHFGAQIINPDVIQSRLDQLGALGIPIWVTEYDSVHANAADRADNLEKLYRIAFAHPGVQGVLMWGYWAGAHWKGADAALVDADWTVNPAGQRYTNLLQEWTTAAAGATDAQGRFSLRGFHGDHDVTLSAPGHPAVTFCLTLANGSGAQTNRMTPGQSPAPSAAAHWILGETLALTWSRFVGAQSCVVESSADLIHWEMVSPRLDPLATAWTVKLASDAPCHFFRVRSDSLPPPDFDFYEAAGARRTATINGGGALSTADSGVFHRNLFAFAAPDLRNGLWTFTEDAAEPSPAGGPPGVLRFRIETRPTTVGQDYWGFILRPGRIADWPGNALTTAHLGKTRVRFRYKLTPGRTLNIRFEPSSAGYNQRCDFGNLSGNGQWREFNRLLSSGSNVTAFLNALNSGGERYLHLVFGNGAGIASYADGDTLLLDDISLDYEP